MTKRKTALVTGGAKRIGKAIVEDLAANGYAVAIHCNNSREDAEKLADEINIGGGQAAVVQADLSDMDDTDGLIGRAVEALGPISVLVNNASVFEADEVTNFEWPLWDMHFAVHVKAPALLAKRFAAALPEGDRGLIVNIIDQRVWRPTPKFFSYSLSKSTMWAMTQTMAQALAPSIRVNAIGPGPTLPNVRQTDDDMAAAVDGILLRQGPALSEFGATIRYLHEAKSVTGQMIALDGGQHLGWETPDVLGINE